ncbi:MAG: hypothetical protein LBF33_02735 [Oscillospiraceae bacterium]|nr:hypothetical protein [Oscillospiraceae bacterium]
MISFSKRFTSFVSIVLFVFFLAVTSVSNRNVAGAEFYKELNKNGGLLVDNPYSFPIPLWRSPEFIGEPSFQSEPGNALISVISVNTRKQSVKVEFFLDRESAWKKAYMPLKFLAFKNSHTNGYATAELIKRSSCYLAKNPFCNKYSGRSDFYRSDKCLSGKVEILGSSGGYFTVRCPEDPNTMYFMPFSYFRLNSLELSITREHYNYNPAHYQYWIPRLLGG